MSKLITPHLPFKINSLCYETLFIKTVSSFIKTFSARAPDPVQGIICLPALRSKIKPNVEAEFLLMIIRS